VIRQRLLKNTISSHRYQLLFECFNGPVAKLPPLREKRDLSRDEEIERENRKPKISFCSRREFRNRPLDKDLAELYSLPTYRLNEQVKRNRNRFPADFLSPNLNNLLTLRNDELNLNRRAKLIESKVSYYSKVETIT